MGVSFASSSFITNFSCKAIAILVLRTGSMGGNGMSATEQIDYQSLTFPYVRAPESDSGSATRRPIVVVGAGPVGLATAIDLAQSGISVLLLDDDDRLSTGSRAICFAKRTLEI